MWSGTHCIAVIVLPILTPSTLGLPACLPQILPDHFSGAFGNYFYFCDESDAVNVLEDLKIPALIKRLSNGTSNEDIKITYDKPQQVGIFVDLDCEDGIRLLLESEELFNASFKWVIWSTSTDVDSILTNLSRLEMDSNLTVVSANGSKIILKDVYRVHFTTDLVKTRISAYDVDNCTVEKWALPERKDFKGFALNTSLMMLDIEFNETNLIEPLLDRAYKPGSDLVRRYGLVMYFHLKEMYKFQERFILSKIWGSELENGSWTGMVGQVQRREAEMGAGPSEFFISRYPVIDYTTPIRITKVSFTFLQPKIFGSQNALILPLHLPVWIGLAICCVAGIVAIRFINSREDNFELKGWGWSFFLVSSAVAQQGIPENSNKLPTRIAHFAILTMTLMVFMHYNAAILNGLLMQAPNAIQNIHQLFKSDFKLGLIDWDYFRSQLKSNDSLVVQFRQKLKAQKKLKKHFFGIEEGVRMIKQGRFALYTEDQTIYGVLATTMSESQICGVTEVLLKQPFPLGFILRDNSPYRELINRGILLMNERGIMKRLRNFWLWRKPVCQWRQDFVAFDFEPLTLAYATLALGFLLSLLVLMGEAVYKRKRARNEKQLNLQPVGSAQLN